MEKKKTNINGSETMKVGELIDQLSCYNRDLIIVADTDEEIFHPVVTTELIPADPNGDNNEDQIPTPAMISISVSTIPAIKP